MIDNCARSGRTLYRWGRNAAGVAARPHSAGGWLVLPGDMPLVRPETLKAVILAMLRHFEEHRGFFEIFVRERLEISRGASRTEGVFAEMEAGTGVMARWLRESQKAGVIRGGDPGMMAVALRGLVFQFTRDWLRSGTKGRLTKFAPFITEFFMKGAGA